MNRFEKIFFAICLSIVLIDGSKNIIAKDLGLFVAVNDKYIDFDEETGIPFAENGRTLVPLRATMEELGVSVNWNQQYQRAELNKAFTTVYVPLDKNYIVVNNKHITIDSKTISYEERIYLPIRFVAEAFGYSVSWDGENNVVEINSFGEDKVPEGIYQTNATVTVDNYSSLNVRSSRMINKNNIDYQLKNGARIFISKKIGMWYVILDGETEKYVYADPTFYEIDWNVNIEEEVLPYYLPGVKELQEAGIGEDTYSRNWIYAFNGAEQWDETIYEISAQYGVDPVLIKVILANESNGNMKTIGASTYYGLMQVGKGWFARLGVTGDEILNDGAVAIDAGIRVLLLHDKGSIYDTMKGYGGGSSYFNGGFLDVYETLSGRSRYDSLYLE